MYEYLIGKITKIRPTYIVLELAGVGYLLYTANPYRWTVNENKKIYVHQLVREDAQLLYAFGDEAEKEVFLKLIAVTGIGPKSALAIIAADDNAGLISAIDTADVKYLTRFPGVGNKTASQMVLDLKGKLVSLQSVAGLKVTEDSSLKEAMEALSALGYKASELKKIEPKLALEIDKSTEDYIKLALKLLIK